MHKAKLKNCYTDLCHQEAVAYLSSVQANSVDLIVAADVFIYIGDLHNVFSASQLALKSGGAIVFTVEEIELGKNRFNNMRIHDKSEYLEMLTS